ESGAHRHERSTSVDRRAVRESRRLPREVRDGDAGSREPRLSASGRRRRFAEAGRLPLRFRSRRAEIVRVFSLLLAAWLAAPTDPGPLVIELKDFVTFPITGKPDGTGQ